MLAALMAFLVLLVSPTTLAVVLPFATGAIVGAALEVRRLRESARARARIARFERLHF